MKSALLTILVCLLTGSLAAAEEKQDVAAVLKLAHKHKSDATAELERAGRNTDESERLPHLQNARDLLQKSRDQFSAADRLLQTQWKSYPPVIDRKENPDQYAARSRVRISLIQVQLEIAENSYRQSRVAKPDAPAHNRLLLQAGQEYEQIYRKYRSTFAGLIARSRQARCVYETGNIPLALGICHEQLAHRGRSEPLLTLQDQARHLQLSCLNHDSRKDFARAIREARQWIDMAPEKRVNSASGQGIRWEFARGLELLARQDSTSPEDRTSLLAEAVAVLDRLKKIKGTYQKPAAEKAQTLRQP